MKLDQPPPPPPDSAPSEESAVTSHRYLASQNNPQTRRALLPVWFKWCLCLAAMLVSAALFYRVWKYRAPGRAIEARSITATWSGGSTTSGRSFATDDFQLFRQMQSRPSLHPGPFTELVQATTREDYRVFFDDLKHRLQKHETLVLYLQAPAIIRSRPTVPPFTDSPPDIELLPARSTPRKTTRGYSLTEALTILRDLIDEDRKVDQVLLILDLSQFQGDLRLGFPDNQLSAGIGDFLESQSLIPEIWHPGIGMLCQTETGPPVWINSTKAYSAFALKVAYALHGGPSAKDATGQQEGYITANDLFSFMGGSKALITTKPIVRKQRVRNDDGSTLWIASPRNGKNYRISAIQPDFSLDALTTDPKSASAAMTSPGAAQIGKTNKTVGSLANQPGPTAPDDRYVTLSQCASAWKRREALRDHLSVLQQPSRWSSLHHWLLRAESQLLGGFPVKAQQILAENVEPLLEQFEQVTRRSPDPLTKGSTAPRDALALLQSTDHPPPAVYQKTRQLLAKPGEILSPAMELLARNDIQAIRSQWATSEIRALEGDFTGQIRELSGALLKLDDLYASTSELAQQLASTHQYFFLFPFIVESARAYDASGQNTQALLNTMQILRRTLLEFRDKPTKIHLTKATTGISRIQATLVEYAKTALGEGSWPRYQAALQFPDLPLSLRIELLERSTFVPTLEDRLTAMRPQPGTTKAESRSWLNELRTFLQQSGTFNDNQLPSKSSIEPYTPNSWFATLADPNITPIDGLSSPDAFPVHYLEYDGGTHELVLEVDDLAESAFVSSEGVQPFSLTNSRNQTRYLKLASTTPLTSEGKLQLRGQPLFDWTSDLSRAFRDSRLIRHRPPVERFRQRLSLLTRVYWSGSHSRLRKATLRTEQKLAEDFVEDTILARELQQQSDSERLPTIDYRATESTSTAVQPGSEYNDSTIRRGPYTMQTAGILHAQPGQQVTHPFVIKPDPLLKVAAGTELVLSWYAGPEELKLSVRNIQGHSVPVKSLGPHQIAIPLVYLQRDGHFAGSLIMTSRQGIRTAPRAPASRYLAARIEKTGTRSYWFPWPIVVGDPAPPEAQIELTWPNLGLRPDTLELLPNQTAPISLAVTSTKAVTHPLRLEFDDGIGITEISYAMDKKTGTLQPTQPLDNLTIPIAGEHLDIRVYDRDRLLNQKRLAIKKLDPWQCFRAEMTFAPDIGEVRARLTNVHWGDIAPQTVASLSQFNYRVTPAETASLSGINESVLSANQLSIHLNAILANPTDPQQSFAISVLGIPRAFRFYFPAQQLLAHYDESIRVSAQIASGHPIMAYQNGRRLLPLRLRVDAPDQVQVRTGIDLNRNNQIDAAEVQLDQIYFKGREQKLTLHATGAPGQWHMVSTMDDIHTDVDVTGLTGRCVVLVEARAGTTRKQTALPLFILQQGPPLRIISPTPQYRHAIGTNLQLVLEVPDGLEQIVNRLEYGIDVNGDGLLERNETVKPTVGVPPVSVQSTQVVSIPTTDLAPGPVTILARTVALVPVPPSQSPQNTTTGSEVATSGPTAPAESAPPQPLRGPLVRRTVQLASTGSLSGTVFLSTGEPVANSYIQLESGPTTRTTAQGHFVFRGLRPGAHRVTASRGPRRGTVQASIRAGQTTRVRVYLSLP
ncbi:MAG: hypothetical protein CMJ75_13185 [Planctomycetaceae bacterium]|nr:hypothetical protein [Planctomycetaceae bacterium]